MGGCEFWNSLTKKGVDINPFTAHGDFALNKILGNHIGIHLKVLVKSFQMNINVAGFGYNSRFVGSFSWTECMWALKGL